MANTKASVEFYKDVGGMWRWRVTARNGKITGCSSEGYVRRIDCTTNMHRLYQAFEPPIRWTKGSKHDEHESYSSDDQGESAGGGTEHTI